MLNLGPKAPSTDDHGRLLSRGIVVSVRNVKASALKASSAGTDDKSSSGKNDTPRYALEYRILQDDGETLVIVTQGSQDDAIGPGQRVLVVHSEEPKVMLETPLAQGQGV